MKNLKIGDRVVIADTAMPVIVVEIGTKGLWVLCIPRVGDLSTLESH